MAGLVGGLATRGRRTGAPDGDEIPADYLGRLLRAIRRTPRATGSVPGRAARDTATGLVEPLTDREFEVLEKLAAGKSNREIADEFVVTLDTVKKHVTHILDKIGAANRTQAVALARELGLID